MNISLQNYISNRHSKYVEPTRAGTPKGDAIGLSSQKYKACLLCLLNVDMQKIAEAVGVSYGLLRKWKTEPLFKDTLAEEAAEMGSWIVDTAKKFAADVAAELEQGLDSIFAQDPDCPDDDPKLLELNSSNQAMLFSGKIDAFWSDPVQEFINFALEDSYFDLIGRNHFTASNLLTIFMHIYVARGEKLERIRFYRIGMDHLLSAGQIANTMNLLDKNGNNAETVFKTLKSLHKSEIDNHRRAVKWAMEC